MKKKRAEKINAEDFSFRVWAEILITKETPIKKATYILSDGGIVDVGIIQSPVGGYRLGAYLRRDAAGNVLDGTVCKFKEPSGETWFRSFQQGFVGKFLN
jgi:hypothetical protein